MKIYEKITLYTLLVISLIFFVEIFFSYLMIPYINIIFDDIIVILFYFLAIISPLYFGIKWLIKPNRKSFKILLLSSLPLIMFVIWFFITIRQLGELLENF